MPESWAAFSGDAWKSFLKRGWNLVVSKEGPSIPVEAYKEIIKSGMKKTGEVFPSWLEQTLSSSVKNIGSVAGSIFARASRAATDYLENLDKKVEREQELRQQAEKDNKDNKDIQNKDIQKTPPPAKKKPAKKSIAKKAPVRKSVKKDPTVPAVSSVKKPK